MSACKELLATCARIKSRSAQLEKYGKEHAESVKSLLVTLDRAIDAIELVGDESENKDKGVKERQAKVSDVIDKQRKKFFDAVAGAESCMHKITACIQQTHGAIEDAEKEAKRVDAKVRWPQAVPLAGLVQGRPPARRGESSQPDARFPRFVPSGSGQALTGPRPGAYLRAMMPAAAPPDPPALAPAHWDRARLIPTRRQLAVVVILAVVVSVGFLPMTHNTYIELLGETLFVGMVLLFAFTLAGAWRQTLLPRWVAQVAAIALGAALSPLVVQLLVAGGDFSAFIGSRAHVRGYVLVTLSGALIGTLFGLGALYRERDAQVRAQALRFALERETLQRQAADARLQLMTAQIEPHFLLNTLANVQQLVESGSPRAAPVFRSLIAYLRAAMPQLHQATPATLGDEERLVRAYLELMLMRMPDRLAFTVEIEPALRTLPFPQMGLLTLVENAIRHGIDPGCDAARIDVGARRDAGGAGVHLWVADTGVGLSDQGAGTGTGLRNLRERLRAFFGPEAKVELSEQAPHGVRADVHVIPSTPA